MIDGRLSRSVFGSSLTEGAGTLKGQIGSVSE
jgi:hypothetical protein